MSSVVDFEALRKFIKVPATAELLLSKAEKEIHFSLTLNVGTDSLIRGDCYVV